ncbi:MAG TPA: DUF5131 family protein [Clostridiales bacterium]|nr:MAG: Phage protein Gp37/Gp68 [Firmicutes bacterium ADurb.Bin262]HOU09262.1 DUF5131 family protein [Clostridiales bacterium]HQK74378.1 DUF5131 family protein [Clostridiales bacterium]
MALWNPWHGCEKISEGCLNCYVYRIDTRIEKDSSRVEKTRAFGLPVSKTRSGAYRVPDGETVYTCLSSDFFIAQADAWRPEAWRMIKQRENLHFVIITKRIERFAVGLPADWGGGYPNVEVCCTVENRLRAASRMPLLLAAPLKRRSVICEPLLEAVDLSPWLSPAVARVTAGGESGPGARACDYAWVLDLRRQCAAAGVAFHFKQTGARFVKDGKTYFLSRPQQLSQAARAGIDIAP